VKMSAEDQVKLNDFGSIFSLEGKVAVVTGGSRGLGLHSASGYVYILLAFRFLSHERGMKQLTRFFPIDCSKPAVPRSTSPLERPKLATRQSQPSMLSPINVQAQRRSLSQLTAPRSKRLSVWLLK
jgi:hypothetical protein